MDLLPADTSVYADGAHRLAEALFESRRLNLQPPPKLTLSQWAAEHAVLSAETSAQTGKFRAYAYQIGMMDAITDPTVTRVTIMKSARVGYTKILDHAVGYFIHQDPSPIIGFIHFRPVREGANPQKTAVYEGATGALSRLIAITKRSQPKPRFSAIFKAFAAGP